MSVALAGILRCDDCGIIRGQEAVRTGHPLPADALRRNAATAGWSQFVIPGATPAALDYCASCSEARRR